MTGLLLAMVACAGGPTITEAEVRVSWSEPDDDFLWWARAVVEHPEGPESVSSVSASLLEEDGPEEVVLDLVSAGELWEVEGLQGDLGLDCCTDYTAIFVATDVDGRVDRHEVLPQVVLP